MHTFAPDHLVPVCGTGKFAQNYGSASCMDAPAGNYVPAEGSQYYYACPPGAFREGFATDTS
jgi:hypothetical protein